MADTQKKLRKSLSNNVLYKIIHFLGPLGIDKSRMVVPWINSIRLIEINLTMPSPKINFYWKPSKYLEWLLAEFKGKL